MSRQSVLARGRRASQAGMVDTCTITRVTGQSTNGTTGVVTNTTSTIYTGPCRFKQAGGVARPDDVGEALVYQLPLEVQLPMTAAGFANGDTVTCNTSLHDTDLPGRTWWVRGLAHASEVTARRLTLEEVTS